MHTNTQFEHLLALLGELGKKGLSIAYSGGLDSRFLSHAALRVVDAGRLHLFHITGPHIPASETAWALDWAAARGLNVTLVPMNPLTLPPVAAGHDERCYFCKNALFTELTRRANTVLCDGSNASDQHGYRPGLRALRELGVRSPLAESGLEKPVIRELARSTGLERPEQQARPCLLTRLPYGMAPTTTVLDQITVMEEQVDATLRALFPERPEPWDFRVRMTADGLTLHLGHQLNADQEQTLRHALNAFPRINMVYAERISGYFDAQPV